MTTFQVTLDNQTPQTWTLTVYLVLPSQPTLASVAWKVKPTAGKGQGSVSWEDQLGVSLATLSGGALSDTVSRTSQAGQAWKAVVDGGAQTLQSDGSAMRPELIAVSNEAGQITNPGLAMDGTGAVYATGVASGVQTQFTTPPQVWYLLADQVSQGVIVQRQAQTQLAVPSRIVGPERLQFPSGQTTATVTAAMDGDTVTLAVSYAAPG